MTTARRLHGGFVAVAAIVALSAWGIGLLGGDLASLDRATSSIVFLAELPFLTFWLVPGSAPARLGVLLSVLVAVDAARVHVLAQSDAMVLAGAWPWLAALAAAALLNGLRRRVTRSREARERATRATAPDRTVPATRPA